MTDRPVVFLSGSARGIGLAAAQVFHGHGWCVTITDVDREEAVRAAADLDASGRTARGDAMDVTATDSVTQAFAAAVAEFGRLDAVVNVAGTVNPQPSEAISDKDWDDLIGVHLDGTFRCCRAAYEPLKASGAGAIVSISSIAARQGIPKRLSYSAAKGGIESMTRVLAVEWADVGIRVNAVAPGYTMTKRMRGTIASGLLEEGSVTRLIPLKRFAEPEEIARGVLFLASADSSYVTGQTLYVDGGVSVNSNW
jgi:NAD(P)-dependent dehydrogenase (short-subunit alcohol dehydrogenase family)